ncbi:MAG: MATE family efflux transporter [Spirochaetales bacterium]
MTQAVAKTNFWKYLIETSKKSSYLVVIGIITALYMTISSVFANTMPLKELTYFNAMFSLAYFSSIIGFGIAGGVAIYINQNYKNKDVVANYNRYGLFLTVILAAIFVILIVLFKEVIFDYIFNIDVAGDYTFFYLMCAYIFLNCINRYFMHTLKNMKEFKAQLLQIAIYSTLIVVALLILNFMGGIYLNLVGFIYVGVSILSVILFYFIFLKNKNYGINLLVFKKLKFTYKEFSTIMYMAFSEIIWQIGYMFTAMFLLKVSEIYFNAYSYYENVLDFFNTLYFSFIVITSIDITRALGENKKDEAYMHGKYSIYFSIFIWVVYALCSLALIVPINSGINIDVRPIATIAMILYVSTHLFRFIVWNLSSYVIIWGGKVKTVFWLEFLSAIYYVLIFVFADYFPSSIYWAFFFISLDNIIKTPIYLIMFKNKKWLVNLTAPNPNPELNT